MIKEAYFLGHLGLGDCITNISALIYLLRYYDKIFFLCNDKYIDNLYILLNSYNDKIILYGTKVHKNTILRNEVFDILLKDDKDIFVSGMFTKLVKKRINNKLFLQDNSVFNSKPEIELLDYLHINNFYKDINLNLNIYINFFDIKNTRKSLKIYEKIKKYKIIFIHTTTSGNSGKTNLEDFIIPEINKYKKYNKILLICPDINMYDISEKKYKIAQYFIGLKVGYYLDIILNSISLHISDSCFACLVLPLYLSKRINHQYIYIYDRVTGYKKNIKNVYKKTL